MERRKREGRKEPVREGKTRGGEKKEGKKGKKGTKKEKLKKQKNGNKRK